MKEEGKKGLKRIVSKLSYMCGSVLSEYLGSGNNRDERYLKSVYVRENISCDSKIELPYFSVDFFPKICIHCEVIGTTRTLGNSVDYYPKCNECKEKPDIHRRKRKALTEADLLKKKK